jgi:hypothetical protein
MNDWLYRKIGRERWEAFCASVNDDSRGFVQKIAMSHFSSVEDFKWLEKNLPNLTSLDISNIKDFVWTPAETWTWNELVEACPKLFQNLQQLEVCNWADYSSHSRVEHCYSWDDYRYKTEFRLSRRRPNGSSVCSVIKVCTNLKTIGIRGCSRYMAWNEWEVHQRVCGLVDGLSNNAPPTLTTLRLHSMSPFLTLLISENAKIKRISSIELRLDSWLHENRDSFRSYPWLTHRMIPGTQHRGEEADFDTGSYETCDRDHMQVGQNIIQWDMGHSNMFKRISTAGAQQTQIKLQHLYDVTLQPLLHLTNIHQPRPNRPHVAEADLSMDDSTFQWMGTVCAPVFEWNALMSDVFPKNLDHSSHVHTNLKPKSEILGNIVQSFEALSAHMPVRIKICDRVTNYGLPSQSFMFEDYKHFVGEGTDRVACLEASQARFNLTRIAPLINELTIQYSLDMPGVVGVGSPNRPLTKGEIGIMDCEKKGWRKFWARYALRLVKLKKLTVLVPRDIFEDWGRSKQLAQLLQDEEWQVLRLEVTSRRLLTGPTFADAWHTARTIRRKSRVKFVKCIFFRQGDKTLQLGAEEMSEEDMLGENKIFAEDSEELADLPKGEVNRFWLTGRKAEKRELQQGDLPLSKKPRVEQDK